MPSANADTERGSVRLLVSEDTYVKVLEKYLPRKVGSFGRIDLVVHPFMPPNRIVVVQGNQVVDIVNLEMGEEA